MNNIEAESIVRSCRGERHDRCLRFVEPWALSRSGRGLGDTLNGVGAVRAGTGRVGVLNSDSV